MEVRTKSARFKAPANATGGGVSSELWVIADAGCALGRLWVTWQSYQTTDTAQLMLVVKYAAEGAPRAARTGPRPLVGAPAACAAPRAGRGRRARRRVRRAAARGFVRNVPDGLGPCLLALADGVVAPSDILGDPLRSVPGYTQVGSDIIGVFYATNEGGAARRAAPNSVDCQACPRRPRAEPRR